MKKHFSLLLMVLLLMIQGAQAAVDYLYFSDYSGLRYKAIITQYQYQEGSGGDLHIETRLTVSYATVCEPAVGKYVGIKTIPETVEFQGDDYVWKDHGIVHFDPKTLNVIGCASGIFEHCLALKKVSFPTSYEQVWVNGNPTKFNSLGVSFKDCSSLLEVENMNLSSIYANQFEGCSSLKKMDLSKTTDIWESAFSGCSSLEELTFKSNVQIRDNAFSNCNAIKKITVQSESNPNSFNDNVFTQTVYEQATLIVPKGKVNKYKRTNGWKNFFKIYEEGSEPSTDPTIEPTDSVTLMVNSYSRQYGEDNPTFEYTVVSGKVESGTPTITCAATKTSPVGTYDIIIEKGSVSNKFVTLVNGTLTITKAPLTISVGNYSKVEGEANPSFTLSYSGFKNGENSSILTKQPTISCSATASSAPGTYPITVSGAEAKNYNINYKNGTLTITAKQTPPVEEAKPYVVYNNGTLTFYCDNQRSSRQGTTYDLNDLLSSGWPAWIEYKESITKAVFDTSFINASPTDTYGWFYECKFLKEIQGIDYLRTDKVKHMSGMFFGCSSLTILDVSKFNTSNVIRMDGMFGGCSNLTRLDVSKFNTTQVTRMDNMFEGCSSLTSLDVSNFSTSHVTDMEGMFANCSSLTNLDISKFNTTNVTKMGEMFHGCSCLTNLDVSNFDTNNVTDMHWMFASCSGLTNLDISKFNTTNLKRMDLLFNGCRNLVSLTMGNQLTSNESTNVSYVFNGCSKLNEVTFTGDIPSSINSKFFEGVGTATVPAMLVVPDVYKANYQAKFDGNMFYGGYFKLNGNDDNPPVGDAKPYVVYDNGTLTFYCDNQRSSRTGTTYNLNEDTTNPDWLEHKVNVKKVVFDASFAEARPTTTYSWFDNCTNLSDIQGMSYLNTSEVTRMEWMFRNCISLASIDLSGFNISNVGFIGGLFYGCSSLTNLDLSSFNTSNVYSMSHMFTGCSNLASLTFSSSFTTYEYVTNQNVFLNCGKLNTVTFTGDIPSPMKSTFFVGVGTADSPARLDVPEQFEANYAAKFNGNKFYGGYFRLNGNDDNPVDAPLEMTCKVLNAVDGIVYDSDVTIKMTRKNTSEQEFNQYAGYKVHRQLENGEWFKNWRGSSSKYALQPGQSLGMRETLLDFEDGFYKVEWGYDDENDNWVSMGSTIIEVRGHDRYKAIWFDEVTMKTFCDDDNLDFSNVEGLKVYIATEFNASTSEVKMQQVNDAVAGTGLLLVGETECYLAERTASASTYSSNMLVGVLGETTYIKSNEDGYTNFIYNGNNKNDEQKFIIASDKGSPVRSNEAYLRVPSQAAGDTQTITPVFDKPTVSDEPYVVYNDITLTFYCDNQRSIRQGVVYSLNEGENEPKWVLDDNNRNVKMVVFDASFAKARPTTTYSWFLYCDYLTEIKGIENLNTSEVKNMHTMFAFCKRLKSVDVSHFDTKAVQDMGAMFSCCTSLENIDLRSFDTSNVFMLLSMFYNCLSLTELDLSNFNTSKAEYLDYMFNGCSNLTTLYFGSGFISTDNVGCDDVFEGCLSLSKVVFTGDIPASINSKFFEGVGTADSPARLDVPEQFEANYAAKFDGNMFYGGYFTLREEIEPDDNGGQDYGNGNGEIDETINLNGNVIGNVYYQISPDKGGYNSAEGCLVVTEPSSDADFDYDNPFGDEFKNMFTGIVIMVQSGSGTIKVEAETNGGMTLKVKVGNNSPITMSFQNKSTLSIPYTVTRPSYVYIYAGGPNATRAAAEGALKIYSFSWESSASGIDDISIESQTFDVYSLSGAMVKKGATSLNALPKGVYIVNGRKVVIK